MHNFVFRTRESVLEAWLKTCVMSAERCVYHVPACTSCTIVVFICGRKVLNGDCFNREKLARRMAYS